ncbi:MAG: hypothetical protein ACXWQR_05670 [Ktedonobacterales bacterium]
MGHLLHLTALAQHYARLVTQRLVAGATDPRSVRDDLAGHGHQSERLALMAQLPAWLAVAC